jgi:hypothetical protein
MDLTLLDVLIHGVVIAAKIPEETLLALWASRVAYFPAVPNEVQVNFFEGLRRKEVGEDLVSSVGASVVP